MGHLKLVLKCSYFVLLKLYRLLKIFVQAHNILLQFFSVFCNINYRWIIKIYTFFFSFTRTFLYRSCWCYVLHPFNSLFKILFVFIFKLILLIKKLIIDLIKCKSSLKLILRLVIFFKLWKLRFIFLLLLKILWGD